MAKKLTPLGILAAARFKACKLMPYFTSAIYMLIPHEQEGLGTLGVTAKAVLFWDPATVGSWGVDQTAGVLLHEVSHLLRKHHARADRMALVRKDFNYKLANVCEDFEINDDLAQVQGVTLPDGGLQPKDHDLPEGKLWEEYYVLLQQRAEQQQGQDGEGGGQPQPGQHPGQGHCGTCARGGEEPNEGKTPDGAGRSEVEVERVQRQVAQAVQQHVEQHGIGSVPAGLRQWASEVFEPPKVDWTDRLFLDVTDGVERVRGYSDYAFDRPARRQLARGFTAGEPLMPRMFAPQTEVTVIFDTSGSMSGEPVRLGVIEVLGVLAALGVDARFIAVDAAVHEDIQVETAEDILNALTGGGGTDFRPAFTHVCADDGPKLIVMVTDGYGPMPSALPDGVEVIGVLCGEHTRIPFAADGGGWSGDDVSYGTWIRVETDGGAAEAR